MSSHIINIYAKGTFTEVRRRGKDSSFINKGIYIWLYQIQKSQTIDVRYLSQHHFLGK